jgi:cytochrome c heme-lyase
MFYNALSRKGKLADTDEKEMENVVAMHNNMNEKTWNKVLEWEKVVAPTSTPKLLKFLGRPHDLSPKATLKHYIMGHPLPYDRHDWTILREDGTTVRYVIDYYYDETRASDHVSSAMPKMMDHGATPSLLVDVRPAIDGPKEVWNRLFTMTTAQMSGSTDYEYLPWGPTNEMKSQVSESVQVWQSIQQHVQQRSSDDTIPNIDEEQAKQLQASFDRIFKECQKAQTKVDKCSSEADCARASIDLTICMGKIACPLQHTALVTVLNDENGDSDIDSALERVNDCVVLQTNRHVLAKEKFPKLF